MIRSGYVDPAILENFKNVLESAYELPMNESHDFVGICLNQLETNNFSLINEAMEQQVSDMLNESAEIDEAFDVTDPHIVKEKKGEGISVTVKGKEYRYVAKDMSTADLFKKFMGMYQHAKAGYKALNWLKSHSLCYYGCKNPQGLDQIEIL